MVQFRPLLRSGWPVIPLSPDGKKTPLVSGYHGKGAKVADEDTVRRWSSQWPDCNPAIVLPPGVIGFDVDGASHGEGVDGLLALAEFEARFGALPASGHIYHGTDGGTGVSPYGTRLYRIPESMLRVYTPGKIVGNLNKVTGLGGVDIIAPWIRYNVAPGAVHHSGEVYGFTPSVHPDLPGSEGFVPWLPRPADLPELTEAHVRALLTVRGQRGPSGEAPVVAAPPVVAPKVRTATGRTDKTLVSAAPSPSAVPSSERGKALLDQVRALAALEEGETLLIEGEERGWQRGNGFYVLACAIARVAKDRDKARRLFVRAAGDFYDAERQWENALAAVELDDEIAEAARPGGLDDDPYNYGVNVEPYLFGTEMIDRHFRDADRVLTLRYRDDDHTFWQWDAQRGLYEILSDDEVRAMVAKILAAAKETTLDGEIRPVKVKKNTYGEMVEHLKVLTLTSPKGGGVLLPSVGGVPFKNGWLDIATGALVPIGPSRDIRWNVPVSYEPDAQCKVWLGFLDSIGFTANSEEYRLLRQFAGYLLSGSKEQEKALLLIGPSRAGKGTIIRTLMALFGDGGRGTSLDALSRNFGLQPLIGKGLATIGDARFGRSNKDLNATLLSLTSNDEIPVDVKYSKPLSINLPVRFVIATNETPNFIEASDALANRFVSLVFEASFIGREDLGLFGRIRAELPGIANWALEGLDDLNGMDKPRFSETVKGAALKKRMIQESAFVRIFVEDCCVMGEGCVVGNDDLYAEYKLWAAQNSMPVFNSVRFGRELMDAFPGSIETTTVRRGGKVIRVKKGLKLL